MHQTHDPLLVVALAARANAVATYSGVKVGAALQTRDGAVIAGANVESPSLIFCICAERAALVAALSAGHREFVRVAVVSDFPEPIPPCGCCRQALLEFAPGIEILMATVSGKTRTATIADLMPLAYRIEDRGK